ncbi:MAG: excinuclease ABC subunit C, partial [Ignavibacteria bacterium]|nr:excinuclease ABC subunit C [Ignavibacteria bacterium]
MVKSAVRLEFIVVNNETDALLLENSLIKKFQPRYNIHLKDDKTYPYICIKKENFPRVFFTRKFIRDGSEYYGPYTSVDKVRSILEFIKVLFPLRNCSLNLSRENINKKKYKVCLEYHLGNCKGPCVDLQSEEDYNNSIQQIRNVLKGQTAPVGHYLKDKMNNAAENYHFEIAEQYKKRLDNLELYKSKTTIVHPKIDNVDVFAYNENENEVYICYLKIANGTIIQTKIYDAVKKIDEEKEDLLCYVIENIRLEMNSNSSEIIVPFDLPYFNESLTITVPQIGDKQKLLDLANKNIFYYKKSKAILKEG